MSKTEKPRKVTQDENKKQCQFLEVTEARATGQVGFLLSYSVELVIVGRNCLQVRAVQKLKGASVRGDKDLR